MKQKRSYKKPSFYVISSAMDGDKISIDKILLTGVFFSIAQPQGGGKGIVSLPGL